MNIGKTPDTPIPYKVGHVIGGAQKGATSALHEMLGTVPEFLLSQPKEAHVFDHGDDAASRLSPEHVARRYAKFFPQDTDGMIPIEATPTYIWHPKAAVRVYNYNPDMKWIICLRNPIARAFSQWRMRRKYFGETRDFLICVKKSARSLGRRPVKASGLPSDQFGLLSRGLYSAQLDRLESLFGQDRIQVLLTANIRDTPNDTLEVCKAFIHDDRVTAPTSIALAAPDSRARPDAESLSILKAFYAPEIDRISERLDLDLSHWLTHPLSD